MKLLYTVNSPYARKVRVVAAEKRVELEMVEVILADPDCPVSQFNPLGKVPVLVMDDGDAIYDSRVIVTYLDHRTPVARLIPDNNTERVEVRRWEALADGVCDAAVAAMLETRRAPEKQDEQVIQKQMAKVTLGLAKLSADLGDKKWCAFETFGLADIALGCCLGYLEMRYKSLDWKTQYPNLAKHYAVMMKRVSFKETIPTGY